MVTQEKNSKMSSPDPKRTSMVSVSSAAGSVSAQSVAAQSTQSIGGGSAGTGNASQVTQRTRTSSGRDPSVRSHQSPPMRQISMTSWARNIAHDNFRNFNKQTSMQMGDFDVKLEEVFERLPLMEEKEGQGDVDGTYGEVYNTYDTMQSADNGSRGDSFYQLCPAFPGGIVRFLLDDGEEIKDRYYVSVQKDAGVDDIARFMAVAWRRRTPKLVLTVISSSQYYRPWTKEKFTEDFQAGIIQAANLTEMWILTEGLDTGVSKLIGDAACIEMTRRRNMEQIPLHMKNVFEKLPRLNIFGITSKSSLIYADVLNGQHISAQGVENKGGKPNLKLYELNPDHSHFILVEDGPSGDADAVASLRFALEVRFTKAVGKPRRYIHMPTSISTLLAGSDGNVPLLEVDTMSTPVMGLMVQGGPPDIDHVLLLLKKRIPVVVILGSGGAADLVAFAYHEMRDRSDKDYLDNYVKPELMRRVSDSFPEDFANNDIARNQCRDKIIECVKEARQDDLTFLTILNTYRHDVRLNDLSKYLLKALFQSQTKSRTGRQWREQLQWDLQLTVDWNRPDLAQSEIFNKYHLAKFRVEDHIFHQALMLPDREAFVELFLEHGMVVHQYLNHKRLANLFENAADKDFFVGVCLEGVLGKNVSPQGLPPVCPRFVENQNCDLNRLLYKLTGLKHLVNPYELSMNSLGSYVTDRAVAERRAINALVFWAVLTNRIDLAKILWRRTENPMAMALVVSMLLHNLGAKFARDIDMKQKMKEAGKEFGQLAVNMLQISYKHSSSLTFGVLSKRLEDFNEWSVMELAKFAANKYFLAHHCCQKWMSRRWLGRIRIRELDFGIFGLPDWFKIYASVFLIFPMYFFISFLPSNKLSAVVEEEEDVADPAEAMLLRVTSVEEKLHDRHRKPGPRVNFLKGLRGRRKRPDLSFCKKIYYLWSAPITKFWLHQLSYICYLVIISIALLLPACGDFVLNTILCVWTLCIWVEVVRQTVVKRRTYPGVSIMRQGIEIFIIMVFVLILLAFRILPFYIEFISFMTTKFLMACGLLYFYFRTLKIFIPISPTLGPMLVSFILMVKKDFINWMRMFLMVLVSGAITMHAVIYPSWPLNYVSLRTAFSRAIFGLFLTKIDDIDGGKDCKHYYEDDNVKYCRAERSLNETQLRELETCANESIFNYAVVIPYLYNAKLVFSTLLFAMFAVTCNRVDKAALEIWKYQRYQMIVDFERRMVLPPPLGIFCYMYYIGCWLVRKVCRLIRRCCPGASCFFRRDYIDHRPQAVVRFHRRALDYNHWKHCINKYAEDEQKRQEEQNRAKTQSEVLNMLMEEVQQHRVLSRQLNDRVIQLETQFTSSCLLLEEMKHMIRRMDPKAQVLPQTVQSMIHISARQSPYPKTSIRRFPVFDKYVPWEVPYETYDPGYYTRPVEEFYATIQVCVDPDILKIKEEAEHRALLMPEELETEDLPPLSEFEPMYNAFMTTVVDGVHVEVDRTSWISQNNQPLRYKLDASGVPQNPFGRTGLRGRGKLWRWGPNHRISAVVTRWRRKYSPLGFPLDHLVVDGKRVLEFLVIPRERDETGDLTLPGGDVYGKTTAFSVMCEEFLKGVFLEPEVEGSLKLDQDDMISFFAQFAKATGTTALAGKSSTAGPRSDTTASGFSASILYRGYIDDPTNTDNAWREAEVWNFHYELYDMFDDKIKEKEKMWREVSPYMRLYGNQDQIVLEAARIHGAYV